MAERSAIRLTGHGFAPRGEWHDHTGHHHSQGQWAQRVTITWQSFSLPEPEGYGSLSAAVEAHLPKASFEGKHLSQEAIQVRDPMLDYPTQRAEEILGSQQAEILQAVGIVTDLNKF